MTKHHPLFIAAMMFLLAMLSGCMASPPKDFNFTVDPILHTYQPNVPLNVGLILTDEFKNATWVSPEHGIIFHVGGALSEVAKEVPTAVFKNVVIVDNKQALASSDINAILVPQLTSYERTRPVFGTSVTIDTAIIKWTLTDKNNSLIWVDTVTIESESAVTTGEAAKAAMTLNPWVAGKHAADRGMKLMAERFFNKSVTAMHSSTEILGFAREADKD